MSYFYNFIINHVSLSFGPPGLTCSDYSYYRRNRRTKRLAKTGHSEVTNNIALLLDAEFRFSWLAYHVYNATFALDETFKKESARLAADKFEDSGKHDNPINSTHPVLQTPARFHRSEV